MKTQPIRTTKTAVLKRSHLRRGLFPISSALALACFAFAPRVQAVDPPPDGGYFGANTAEGDNALFSLTSGVDNTAIGFDALFSNTTGSRNTANGNAALYRNTTGNFNTANGADALFSNTTGYGNTANGVGALYINTTGAANTANGSQALYSNTTGVNNTANGYRALYSNTTGIANTANGDAALEDNTTGGANTANGSAALLRNTTGERNTANGYQALFGNTIGSHNTANGVGALSQNTTGSHNTANGYQALFDNSSGSNNIALGNQAGYNLTTGDNNIDIGNLGVAAEAGTIRIGTSGTQTSAFVAGIYGATVAKSVAVFVDSSGRLGTKASSERFKDAIQPMDKASEAILALKPVTFHYKKPLDPEGIPQFGLIAEEVAKVNPDLVERDENGEIYTVRYEAVNAMLLNEFLKEHRTVEQLKNGFETTIAQQQKEIEALTASLKEQGSQLQKLSAQLQPSNPAARVLENSQ